MSHRKFGSSEVWKFASLILVSVASIASAVDLSKSELDRIDQHFADYYKNVVVTSNFVDELGQFVSCVDFYRQPAINALPITDQRIQTQPSAALKAVLKDKYTEGGLSKNCAPGSIEMLLPTRDQAIAAGGLIPFLGKKPSVPDKFGGTDQRKTRLNSGRFAGALAAGNGGHYWANTTQTFAPSVTAAIGVRSTINVWKPAISLVPSPAISNVPFSLAQIWVNGGDINNPSNPLQSAEAGFQVYQIRYQDNDVHFFVFFSPDFSKYGQPGYGCQDLTCTAFIVFPGSPLLVGGKIATTSVQSGAQVEMSLAWYRDPATRNWTLFLWDAVNGYRGIGYYPGTLYGTYQLSRSADRIAVGGEIFSPTTTTPTIPMGSGVNTIGSGLSASGYYSRVAYHKNVITATTTPSDINIGANITLQDFGLSWYRIEPMPPLVNPLNEGCAYGGQIFTGLAPYSAGWGWSVFFGGSGFTSACTPN